MLCFTETGQMSIFPVSLQLSKMFAALTFKGGGDITICNDSCSAAATWGDQEVKNEFRLTGLRIQEQNKDSSFHFDNQRLKRRTLHLFSLLLHHLLLPFQLILFKQNEKEEENEVFSILFPSSIFLKVS